MVVEEADSSLSGRRSVRRDLTWSSIWRKERGLGSRRTPSPPEATLKKTQEWSETGTYKMDEMLAVMPFVKTNSKVLPRLCVAFLTCWIKSKLDKRSRNSVAFESELSLTWKFKSPRRTMLSQSRQLIGDQKIQIGNWGCAQEVYKYSVPRHVGRFQ